MNRKVRSIILVGTATLTLLVAVSAPHIGREPPPVPRVSPVPAFTHADRVIPPPGPPPTPVGEKASSVELRSTPPTEIDSEPPKPRGTTAISTAKEPPRGKPTPEPSPPKTTASVTATEPQMGDTRIVDGQKQVYFLGFGWIEDSDEPNVCIIVDGEGDINKMVGIM